jgi:hypothetical protein
MDCNEQRTASERTEVKQHPSVMKEQIYCVEAIDSA